MVYEQARTQLDSLRGRRQLESLRVDQEAVREYGAGQEADESLGVGQEAVGDYRSRPGGR